MHKVLQISSIIFLFFVTGCMMVGPRYKKPDIDMPHSFKYKKLPQDTIDLNYWWEVFNDVTLSDLIKKALASNYNLHKAMEHIEEFRALYQIQQAQLFPEVDSVGALDRLRYSDTLLFLICLMCLRITMVKLDFLLHGRLMYGEDCGDLKKQLMQNLEHR